MIDWTYHFFKVKYDYKGFFPDGLVVKNPPTSAVDTGPSLGQEDSLEKEMATLSSTLAREIPWTEEPGQL